MIRTAEKKDIHQMIAMGRKFHEQTPMNGICPFDDVSFEETLQFCMKAENATSFVFDEDGIRGMTAVVILPTYFNKNYRIANELFCWLDPEARGHGLTLYDTLEEWAAGKAETLVIARVAGIRDEAMDRLYQSRGFIPTDYFYSKSLCHRQ